MASSARRAVLLLWTILSLCPAAALAQNFDPRGPLLQMIQAFQRCGPTQTYQMLSPELFQIVYAQTNGSGCYPAMAAAGAITDMRVLDQKSFPVGPAYAIRVTHQFGAPVDWFVGYNLAAGRIVFLTFQAVVARNTAPTVLAGPTNPIGGSTNPARSLAGKDAPQTGSEPAPKPAPRPKPRAAPTSDGCNLYPDMCR